MATKQIKNRPVKAPVAKPGDAADARKPVERGNAATFEEAVETVLKTRKGALKRLF